MSLCVKIKKRERERERIQKYLGKNGKKMKLTKQS